MVHPTHHCTKRYTVYMIFFVFQLFFYTNFLTSTPHLQTGFTLSATNPPEGVHHLTQQRADAESKKFDKWLKMLSQWDRYGDEYAKVKRRVRNGIPEGLRGFAWQLLLGSRELALSQPDTYQSLLACEMDPELREIAKRDLPRTFTTNVMFLSERTASLEDDFQQTLYRLLHAYAVYDPRIGYCQGMGFLAATFLSQMKEEDAFWAFATLMRGERFNASDMYLPGFPKVQQSFRILGVYMERFTPRLAQHLEFEMVNVSYFASRWFMTLFANVLPTRRALAVWDLFFVEGWKVIFRVAMALLIMDEVTLLNMGMEDLMHSLKTLQEDKDISDILSVANSLKITNSEIAHLTAAILSEES